jgi:hypothetical protein
VRFLSDRVPQGFLRRHLPAPKPIVRVEDDMQKLPFRALALVSVLRRVVGAVVTFLGPSWDGAAVRYRPEDHYMRGPGPKWREKHSL